MRIDSARWADHPWAPEETLVTPPDVPSDSPTESTCTDTEQHSLPLSILLHLLPGAALTVFIVAAAPVVRGWGLPAVFALFVGIGLVIAPIELGILFAHARRTTGTWRLHSTVVYRQRLPRRRLIPVVIALFAWFTLLLIVSTALLDAWIAERFFAWIPDAIRQFSDVGAAGESAPVHLVVVMLVVAFVLNGFVGPVVEELYFRGYLLPRIDRLGRWAPVLNTTLFSIYHFWTPWQNPARILGFLPIAWVAWRRQSVQVAIAGHVSINVVFLLGMVALIAQDLS